MNRAGEVQRVGAKSGVGNPGDFLSNPFVRPFPSGSGEVPNDAIGEEQRVGPPESGMAMSCVS